MGRDVDLNPALVSWEAEYEDGTIYAERKGGLYEHIDRDRLRAFRIVGPGEILSELRTKTLGHSLAYRRRTIASAGKGREIWFVMGFVPEGPMVAICPERMVVHKSRWFEAGPLAPMEPLPFEGWSLHAGQHGAGALLQRPVITLPSGYRLSTKGLA